MKRTFVTALVFIFVIHSQAGQSKNISVTGIIKSFDQNEVVLNQDGHYVKMARKLFPKKIRSGEKVTVEIERTEAFAEKK